jgi:NAD+ kinase
MRAKAEVIGLVLNIERPDARDAGRAICREMAALGVKVLVERRSARWMGAGVGLPLASVARKSRGLVVVGGDGTLLSTVPDAMRARCPVVGINAGSLGFLTTIPLERAVAAVREFVAGEWVESQRTLLTADIHRPGRKAQHLGVALNDVVVTRPRGALMVHFAVRVDGELVTEYAADGLIVATPTGSTAYSLSSNGAVLVPNAPVLSLTPICPHALTNRPVILADSAEIRIRPEHGDALSAILDGRREVSLPADGEIRIRRAPQTLTLAVPPNHSFFKVLRRKLRWSGTNV